ncbi:hypothetical protein EVAR_88250_1 [Eumeta japonica]|uniref:Uncharacterized protein n=1 Tax=Eumeta variegata TaxID=151549 RepID=A0A4C1XLG8_EUMVA|nr:hypothetical protein EVAR_88250_1 [Eumeta japonica]
MLSLTPPPAPRSRFESHCRFRVPFPLSIRISMSILISPSTYAVARGDALVAHPRYAVNLTNRTVRGREPRIYKLHAYVTSHFTHSRGGKNVIVTCSSPNHDLQIKSCSPTEAVTAQNDLMFQKKKTFVKIHLLKRNKGFAAPLRLYVVFDFPFSACERREYHAGPSLEAHVSQHPPTNINNT